FKSAQATFLKADELRDRLTDDQKKQLDEYLKKVNDAAKQQAAALGAYDDGLEALKANDLKKAQSLFEQVARNEFVHKGVRKDARTQRALVIKRIEEAKTAADAKTADDSKTTTEKTTEKPAPAPKSESDVAAKAKIRFKRLQAKIDKAKDSIVKGNKALDADKVEQAIAHFEQAIKIAPQYKPAHERLAFAKSLVGSGGGLAAITRLEKIRSIRKQQTEVLYTKAMQQAREAVQSPRGKEDFAKATEEVNYAKTLLATNKSLFTSKEYSDKKIETEKLAEYIEMVKLKWQKEQVAIQREEIKQRKLHRERDMRRQKREKIATLKARADTLCDEQKYKQAIDVYGQILKLDPNDVWAKKSYSRLDRFVQILDAKDAYRTSMR
ncbi:MAG: hypothetical protein KAV00_02555, partial [Phycisphaerae bacterium]|nr:hypothetical protein [Phycisphaerae bacterium]